MNKNYSLALMPNSEAGQRTSQGVSSIEFTPHDANSRTGVSQDELSIHNPLSENGRLLQAITEGDNREVERLLQAGVNADAPTGWELPLHLAAHSGNLPIVELLLDAGAQINARDHYGFTPLHHAVLAPTNAVQLVELLLAQGADGHARNFQGDTPYCLAMQDQNLEVAGVLRLYGAETGGVFRDLFSRCLDIVAVLGFLCVCGYQLVVWLFGS